ncbi:LysR family transcriptional regulator [Amycolatopsis sp. WAC 04182]|uniref:LysR family transcriptional regulator n=1 Tax=Amycolatopsis sp. WAC 04182 TaxID=2203198 RepID=UPI000F790E8A|nr:LysR family transcriptional regulator [Amycolatopsis sp. WAC 04182]RSN53537.1 LysR family transcriptional regulator [Amycolatopsis sp. WAC 04182]
MPLDPRRLLLLRAVKRTGSVLAAARALHLTPSGISQHLGKLEAEAGLALIDRDRRGGGRSVQLTPAGKALAEHAERLAEALAAAERGLQQFREGATGPLKVGGVSVVLSELVAPVAMRMAAADSSMDPCIYELTDSEGVPKLIEGHIDVLLSERAKADGVARAPGLTEIDLVRDPFQVVIPGTWTADTGPAALLARPWVTTSSGSATRDELERLCRQYGVELDAHDIGAGSASTLIALVSHGLGAAVVSSLALRQNPASNVRVCDVIMDPGSRVITALYRSDASPAVLQLVTELKRFAATELRNAFTHRGGHKA